MIESRTSKHEKNCVNDGPILFFILILIYIGVNEVFGVAVDLSACSNDLHEIRLLAFSRCRSETGKEPHYDSTSEVRRQDTDGNTELVIL